MTELIQHTHRKWFGIIKLYAIARNKDDKNPWACHICKMLQGGLMSYSMTLNCFWWFVIMENIVHGPLARYENCGLCMRREYQERFPRHRVMGYYRFRALTRNNHFNGLKLVPSGTSCHQKHITISLQDYCTYSEWIFYCKYITNFEIHTKDIAMRDYKLEHGEWCM